MPNRRAAGPRLEEVFRMSPMFECRFSRCFQHAAQDTLKTSQQIADTILGPVAHSDLVYWFARLYAHIKQFEIRDKDKLTQPCFLLHFERQSWIDRYFGLHKGCLGRVAAT
jgi:hypothetical protein